MIPHATIDLESRSACSIKRTGAWRYAEDPTTEILCMAYRMPHWTVGRVELWHPKFKHLGIPDSENWDALEELIDWIESGGLVEAHNSQFEKCMWLNIMVPRHGFPPIPNKSFRCSAAKAAAHALPRKLGEAGAALKLDTQKDDAGHKLMLKLSKPRKPRKKEREDWLRDHGTTPMPLLWWESLALFQQLWTYCAQDVLAEEALSHSLADLSTQETMVYLLDQTINQRGFQIDVSAVSSALKLISSESQLLNLELSELTGGQVTRATQRAKLTKWLETQNVHLDDTTGATIDSLLVSNSVETIPPPARRALEILRTLGRSSTAKYQTMRLWACVDGRVRGGLLYHGATTGRWSGAGVQPHNFPKGTIKGFEQEEAWKIIKTGNRTAITAKYPSVMETLACALRGAIVAGENKQLYVADYASIEARVLLWLADDQRGIELFRNGADIYCDMASDIYDRPITKEENPNERQLGKATILGAGFGMGYSKFVDTAATYGVVIDEEFSQRVINTYREKYHRVKQLWYDVEDTMFQAMKFKGQKVACGRIHWLREDRFLYCILPSERRLAYPEPELRLRETPWGAKKMALTFMGVNTHNRQWQRQSTYGASLVENATQAVARDFMAHALLNCEAEGVYMPILSVHDEILAETPLGVGSVAEFEKRLTTVPAWGRGCPIAAEGWSGVRYHK